MTKDDLIAMRGAMVIRTNAQRYPEGYGSPAYSGPVIAPAWRNTLDERVLERRGLTRAQFDQMLADAGLDPVALPDDEGDVLSDEAFAAANAPPPPARADVNAERDRRIAAGFTYLGKKWQFDPDSKQRVTGAATLAGFAMAAGAKPHDYRWANPNNDFMFIASDNEAIRMDAPTAFAFGQTAANHETRHIFAARAIKEMDPIPADYADDKYWP